MDEPRTAYDEKLESILRTAAVVFAERGYHQASIRDIARATGVSLSGLYYYFRSKEELLFLIQDHSFGTLLTDQERLLAGIGDPTAQIRLLVHNHLRYFLSNMAEMKVLSHEADSLSGEYQRVVNAKKRRLTELAMAPLRQLRALPEPELRAATFALFGMMNWLYNWYRPDRDLATERLAEVISGIFLEGYLSDGVVPLIPAADELAEAPSIWRSGSAQS